MNFDNLMRQRTKQMLAVFGFLIVAALYVPAQNPPSVGQRATSVRIEMAGIYGPLFITIAGKEERIADEAQKAWTINGGRHVVYSSSKGAGGFENEGQGLHIYDVGAGSHRQIMSEYYMVDTVKEVVTSRRKRALLVTMSDGGLGASYVAVVDPWRGEVFFRPWARILSHKGDTVVLGFYKEADWDQIEKARPYKITRHNLNSLLLKPVIVNERNDPGTVGSLSRERPLVGYSKRCT
jgi:hypothetical protein